MLRKIGLVLALAIGIAGLALLVAMALVRRDHQIEMVVFYPKSPPAAVWRLLTDHAGEPQWLPAFGSVVRGPDIAGHAVWTHTSPDRSFSATAMTVSAIPEKRYERLLLREGQPRHTSWDGRWVYELEARGAGTRLTIKEYGWTDGIWFFLQQRVLSSPDAFLQYYARMMGRALKDEPEITVVRAH